VVQDHFLDQIDHLTVWKNGSKRAPHKPLLLLLALGRLSQGQDSLQFSECEIKLTELLREFGPSGKSYHPEYPFWRLQNDGLWKVESTIPLAPRQSNTDPPKSQLRLGNAVGSFTNQVRLKLLNNPSLIGEAAKRLLTSHFSETLHQDILDSVGLSIEPASAAQRRRDPQFRSRVLIAYEYSCALCGLDLRIGNVTIALEAAHIHWHQAGGPDTASNGIALCSLHHKLFDLGAFTIHTDYRILVSEQAHGAGQFEQVLLRHHGQQIRHPSRPEHVPLQKHIDWHRREVFKEGVRFLDGVA